MRWVEDASALELLSRDGGPFSTPAYRTACVEAVRGARDVSYAALADDGTRAAIALIRRRLVAESLPFGYGGVMSTRPLGELETAGFLHAARSAAGAARLVARTVAFDKPHVGQPIATTSVVFLDQPPESGFSKTTRYSIRRAERAGARVIASGDPETFLRLYEEFSEGWMVRYPPDLVRALARRGAAHFYDVLLQGDAVASVLVLIAADHWLYWLGARVPGEPARSAKVGYLAIAAMLGDAHAAGVSAANLGASMDLPGVAEFKRRLGAVERPVLEVRSSVWGVERVVRPVAKLRRARGRVRLRTRIIP